MSFCKRQYQISKHIYIYIPITKVHNHPLIEEITETN
jgi:hypothetical protein